MSKLFHEQLSKVVLDAMYKVHSKLGPGLLEGTYESILAYELRKRGLEVEQQLALPLIYEEIKLDRAYRLDLIVNHKIIIELKSVEKLKDVHFKQLTTYLRLSKIKVGFLVNFNVASLKGNVHRRVV